LRLFCAQAADLLTEPLGADTYSMVLCRDVLISVQDKLKLLQRMCAALKPGGQLVLTDYCAAASGPAQLTEYLNCNNFYAVERRELAEVFI
jgi:chemotaxis methyl-accepting protein methylase